MCQLWQVSGKHYPLTFCRFRKRAICTDAAPFRTHTELAKDLVDWAVKRQIPGDFTFDSDFTNADLLHHIHGHGRAHVGDLKANRLVTGDGKDWKASEWIATCPGSVARTEVTVGGVTPWYFSKAIRLPKVTHPVRILVPWASEYAERPSKILITNRTYWEAHRILKGYRRRWTGTETVPRDGKQHLGMGEGQLRTGAGQTRHRHLVVLVDTALMRQLKHDRAQEWAQMRLTTIGEACRLIARETLAKTLAWVVEQVHAGRPFDDIKHALALP